MKDQQCIQFLQWLLPQLQMRWPGFRKVRRQVCRRIDRRLSALGLPDLAAYQDWIAAHPDELLVLDGYCRITISRFYRDRGVFDVLRDEVLLDVAANARDHQRGLVRCWSAGCAAGEEPYTVNIIWQRVVAPRMPGLKLEILATDTNPQMLERARVAGYPRSAVKDLPAVWLSDCFQEQGGQCLIRPQFREGIEFQQQDIRRQMPSGLFDVILCRHLAFTYFDEPLQIRILDQLVRMLNTRGFLVTGKQEQLPSATPQLTEYRSRTGIYRKVNNVAETGT